MVNDLIKTLYEMNLTDMVYNIFFGLGFVSVFCVIFWFGKKLNLKPMQSVLTVLIVYPVVVAWMFILFWIESGFTVFGGNNIVRVFIYIPLVAYPVSKLLKIEWNKICSLLAFGPVSVHAISHFGCIFAGCCRGYRCSWGIYNVIIEDYCFPIQPIEAIGALAIIVYLIIRAKKRNYVPDGREFPLMLALFGSTRFIFEFFRDNGKILLGCSSLSFHALFMFFVGVVWLVVLWRMGKPKAEGLEANV